jgi:hypothetical protein
MPPDAFFGDVMISCMDLLVNLVNTNFLPTHLELLRTLSSEDTSLTKLFEAVYADPTRSNYNASLSTMISYILYSKTGEQRPLITYLLKVSFIFFCVAFSFILRTLGL